MDLQAHAASVQVKGAVLSTSAMALMLHSVGRGFLRLCTSLCGRQLARQSRVMFSQLPELVSFPIPLDDEASGAGSDAGADDTLPSGQQPAAQTRPEERQRLPTAEPAADNKTAEQVRQRPPAWQPQHASQPASLMMLGVSVSHAHL